MGVGECVPNSRYQETIDSTISQIEKFRPSLESGLSKDELQSIMPAGAARNAVDCALWDLEAKQLGQDVGIISGLGWPARMETVETISISTPEDMHKTAQYLASFPIIKIKMNADRVRERITAVHAGAPSSRFLIDANESWTIDLLRELSSFLIDLNVQMVEQPLHADHDDALAEFQSDLPIYADESCHTSDDLPLLKSKYSGVNIKLDKTGGLTEAIALEETAYDQGFQIMIGCMLSTSLGIAPTMLITKRAHFVDIDAPSLLAKDRPNGLQIKDGKCSSLDPRLWGSGQME